MRASFFTEVRHRINCPECGKPGASVDHLMAADQVVRFGPWYCDGCGCGFTGVWRGAEGAEIELTKDRLIKTHFLLRIRPQSKEIFIAVDHPMFEGRDEESNKFFVESLTCPSNLLRRTVEVSIDGKVDPHGLLEYARSAPAPEPGQPFDMAATFNEVLGPNRPTPLPKRGVGKGVSIFSLKETK